MSFSTSVKDELIKRMGDEPCCKDAQNYGFSLFSTGEGECIDFSRLHRDCCKRAFLRGAFLSGGYIIEPKKTYHLEIIANSRSLRNDFAELLQFFELEPKWIKRNGLQVFYFKGSEKISDFLAIIGAHKSMLEFLNVKIEKELRGNVNRMVNCETANVDKSVSASGRQIKAIKTIGIDNIPEQLQEVAKLRLDNPEMSLKELGELTVPFKTKSAVNHALSRIIQLAERLHYD